MGIQQSGQGALQRGLLQPSMTRQHHGLVETSLFVWGFGFNTVKR